jgi:hypothetical protein
MNLWCTYNQDYSLKNNGQNNVQTKVHRDMFGFTWVAEQKVEETNKGTPKLKSQGGAATTQEPCVEVLDMCRGDDFLHRNFN